MSPTSAEKVSNSRIATATSLVNQVPRPPYSGRVIRSDDATPRAFRSTRAQGVPQESPKKGRTLLYPWTPLYPRTPFRAWGSSNDYPTFCNCFLAPRQSFAPPSDRRICSFPSARGAGCDLPAMPRGGGQGLSYFGHSRDRIALLSSGRSVITRGRLGRHYTLASARDGRFDHFRNFSFNRIGADGRHPGRLTADTLARRPLPLRLTFHGTIVDRLGIDWSGQHRRRRLYGDSIQHRRHGDNSLPVQCPGRC